MDRVWPLNLKYVRTQKESSVASPPVIKSIYVKLGFDSQCDDSFFYASFPVNQHLRIRLENSKRLYVGGPEVITQIVL